LTRGRGGEQVVKVLDFGIAKIQSNAQHGRKTQIGSFVGTPWYCAPEQITGGEVGPHTDVYALGVTAYELLTGRLPFDGDVQGVFAAKTSEELVPARMHRPELPAVVDHTLRRMMAREPADRPEDMAVVRHAIADWPPDETEAASPDAGLAVSGRPRGRLWAVAAALVVLGLAGAGWFAIGRSGPGSSQGEATEAPDRTVSELEASEGTRSPAETTRAAREAAGRAGDEAQAVAVGAAAEAASDGSESTGEPSTGESSTGESSQAESAAAESAAANVGRGVASAARAQEEEQAKRRRAARRRAREARAARSRETNGRAGSSASATRATPERKRGSRSRNAGRSGPKADETGAGRTGAAKDDGVIIADPFQ
jgi:serine/threonine-protein kinase